MDANNNWRPAQPEPSMDAADWRAQVSPESRQRVLNKIMDTLKRHISISGPDGLVELRKVASRFEERSYSTSTSQDEYLQKISMKMLTMENRSPNGVNNSLLSNSGGNQNPPDTASQCSQSQLCSPGQSLPISIGNQSQPHQQFLSQNLQNTIASGAVQSPPSLPTALSSVTGLTQTAMSNIGQNSNLQTVSGISQNSVNNSAGQGVRSNVFSNPQRQMKGRQHPRQQQQQSQNPQQFYQHHMINQKLQPGIMQPSLLQSHMPQQRPSVLQPNQMQSSQQSLMQMSSAIQSSQSTLQQIQPSMVQSAPQSSLKQNQQFSVQQSGSSGLQQHQQSFLRQQQPQPSMHQQTSVLHQQEASINQQPILSSQQQLMAQQPSATNMQQNQLLAQQNSVLDMQQQQHQQQMMLSQQNNLSNIQQQHLFNQPNKNLHQQQQLGQHNSFSGLQQQQQLIGSQPGLGVSSMQQHQPPVNILQQTKVVAQQQQPQQTPSTFFPSQGQQSDSQPPQQLTSQSQPVQSQQQQQPSALPLEMQQRVQTSASLDSTAQAGHAGIVDWQEEVYQKIKSMKESYLPELNELYQKIAMKCQQVEALAQHPKQSDQIDKIKSFKITLKHMITFLQGPKSIILPTYKEKLSQIEKQIIGVLSTNRFKKPASSQQPGHQQLQQSSGQSHLMTQQSQSQIPQSQQQENHVNSMQPMNIQGSMTSMSSTAVPSLQHGSMSLSTYMGVPSAQQNMMNALQTSANLEPASGGTGRALRSLPLGVAGSLPPNIINVPQQTNISALSQSSVNQLQPSINSLQPSSNLLQQHLKQQQQQQQEQQLFQSQQLKQQYQQLQMIQQQRKQQTLQRQQQAQMQQQFQQQLHQQQKQQQPSQLWHHQIPQLHQMNEVNELKVRPGAGIKAELFPQPHLAGQRQTYQQQLKMGAPFPVSSPQLLQAASPQLSQNSSPQIDQQNLHSTYPKIGTRLQSANSPLISTSPSTPVAPSPLQGDSEKQLSAISSTSNAGNIGHQQTVHGLTQTQSLTIGTPGISASPLLAEFTSLDGNQGDAPSNLSGKSSTTEQPHERLIKVVRSMSPKVLGSSVNDIGSVVSMIDRIAGSAPGNGSRAAFGEDLTATTKCCVQARNFMSHEGSATAKRMRRWTSALPLNPVSSAGSVNDSFERLSGLETSELESTATSRIKRHKAEANHALLEEVKEINKQLIDTALEISDEDVDSIVAAAKGEGTIVKCSFNAVALSSNLKSQYASAQISPILPVRLLVPPSYPNCSPIPFDKLPVEARLCEDLSFKAKWQFRLALRGLLQPISLGDMAKTWDDCARMVIAKYAQESGGGSFSSKYGTWENCVNS